MGGQRNTRTAEPNECCVIPDPQARDRAIAARAARQHGVITHAQLRSIGLTGREIERRVERGLLRRLHRGVYIVGAVAPALAVETAAVLACGAGAVLSHRSGAELWRLLPRRSTAVDVTTPGRNPRARPGIRVHRVVALDPRDGRVRHRIPVTAPARTLLDVAATARPGELEQAVAEAHVQRLARTTDIASVLSRYPLHRGRDALRELIAGAPTLTRSEAERRLLELVRRARLPEPETAVSIGPYEVDFLWRAERLAIEVDGFQFHSSRASFERDRMRDAELQSRGYRVVRITWRQLDSEPEAVLVRIVRLLGTPSDLEAPAD